MKIYIFIVLTGLLITTACGQSQQTRDDNIKNVSASEFKTIVKSGDGQLIDIRTPAEYNSGHIQDAIMIDFYSPDFKSSLDKLDKEKPIYIYCRSGNRSAKTLGLLQELGFKEIVNLKGGLIDWQKTGYALSKG